MVADGLLKARWRVKQRAGVGPVEVSKWAVPESREGRKADGNYLTRPLVISSRSGRGRGSGEGERAQVG